MPFFDGFEYLLQHVPHALLPPAPQVILDSFSQVAQSPLVVSAFTAIIVSSLYNGGLPTPLNLPRPPDTIILSEPPSKIQSVPFRQHPYTLLYGIDTDPTSCTYDQYFGDVVARHDAEEAARAWEQHVEHEEHPKKLEADAAAAEASKISLGNLSHICGFIVSFAACACFFWYTHIGRPATSAESSTSSTPTVKRRVSLEKMPIVAINLSLLDVIGAYHQASLSGCQWPEHPAPPAPLDPAFVKEKVNALLRQIAELERYQQYLQLRQPYRDQQIRDLQNSLKDAKDQNVANGKLLAEQKSAIDGFNQSQADMNEKLQGLRSDHDQAVDEQSQINKQVRSDLDDVKTRIIVIEDGKLVARFDTFDRDIAPRLKALEDHDSAPRLKALEDHDSATRLKALEDRDLAARLQALYDANVLEIPSRIQVLEDLRLQDVPSRLETLEEARTSSSSASNDVSSQLEESEIGNASSAPDKLVDDEAGSRKDAVKKLKGIIIKNVESRTGFETKMSRVEEDDIDGAHYTVLETFGIIASIHEGKLDNFKQEFSTFSNSISDRLKSIEDMLRQPATPPAYLQSPVPGQRFPPMGPRAERGGWNVTPIPNGFYSPLQPNGMQCYPSPNSVPNQHGYQGPGAFQGQNGGSQ